MQPPRRAAVDLPDREPGPLPGKPVSTLPFSGGRSPARSTQVRGGGGVGGRLMQPLRRGGVDLARLGCAPSVQVRGGGGVGGRLMQSLRGGGVDLARLGCAPSVRSTPARGGGVVPGCPMQPPRRAGVDLAGREPGPLPGKPVPTLQWSAGRPSARSTQVRGGGAVRGLLMQPLRGDGVDLARPGCAPGEDQRRLGEVVPSRAARCSHFGVLGLIFPLKGWCPG
ncbi:hypothetical protein MicB006_0839 [Micromonospora sp. B006]|nr:hypothetical protein MicB006_0839 [Micromonospora sp. B006]